MPTDATSLLAVTLVTAGVLAELAVLRLFVREAGRPKVRRGPLQPAAGAAVFAAILASPALAAPPTEPLLAQAAITLSPPPQGPLTISTDRPSFGDGTGLMPVGHVNLETGASFAFSRRDGVESWRFNGPEVLVRAGVLEDRLEVRILTSGFVLSRTDAGAGFGTSEGWGDAAVGLKVKVCDQDGWVPRIAVGVQTTVGAGSEESSSRTMEPTVKLLWSYDLGAAGDRWKGWTLGGNLNAAWTTTDGDRFVQGQASLGASFPLTATLSGFAEYFVVGPAAKGSDAAHAVDLGVMWLATDRVQFDARVGIGLNTEADRVFGGVGVSFLF